MNGLYKSVVVVYGLDVDIYIYIYTCTKYRLCIRLLQHFCRGLGFKGLPESPIPSTQELDLQVWKGP